MRRNEKAWAAECGDRAFSIAYISGFVYYLIMTVEHRRLKGTMQAYVLAEQKVSGTRGLALEMLREYIKSAGRGASSQLASELEISQQYLSDILTSKRELNLALAERILGVL